MKKVFITMNHFLLISFNTQLDPPKKFNDSVGVFFQVTPSKIPLFVTFKGILSKFLYKRQAKPMYITDFFFVNCNVYGVL